MSSLILDISNWNETPEWATIRKHGIEAVWLKATEGLTFNDKDFHTRRSEARKHGLHVGAYHFAHMGNAHGESSHFITTVQSIARGDLLPMLDVERAGAEHLAEEFSRDFNRFVHEHMGLWPLFYSYSAYIKAMHPARPIGGGLVLAAYSRNDGREHPFTIPQPWKRTLAHQFSSQCSVIGCRGKVDLSTTHDLARLVVR